MTPRDRPMRLRGFSPPRPPRKRGSTDGVPTRRDTRHLAGAAADRATGAWRYSRRRSSGRLSVGTCRTVAQGLSVMASRRQRGPRNDPPAWSSRRCCR